MRKITEFDNSVWDEGLSVWKSILAYRREKKNPTKSQLAYFDLYIDYLTKLQKARDEGGFIVAHATSIPAEILYAMDMTPILLVGTCFAITQCVKQHPKFMQVAKEYGISSDTCSAHRGIISHCLQGALPKPNVFIDVGSGCDAFSNSMKIAADLYDTPHYQVDAPYYGTERSIKYLAEQFEDMIRFLERESGRKMDWDRLSNSLHYSQRMAELWGEVWELRKAVPTPMDNRRAWETNWINWFFYGTPEGVKYWEVLRDELKERVEKGVSAFPDVKERFRILDLFMGPAFDLRIEEWMQQEWGANIVAETLIYYKPGFKMEPEKPLESLAVRWYAGPIWSTVQGPVEDYNRVAVQIAKDFKADAAVWWDQKDCRQAGAIKLVEDALERDAGIPTVRIDLDITDPSFVSSDEVKENLSSFFEILESRKEG